MLKVPSTPKSPVYFGHGAGAQQDTNTVLFDLRSDPAQLHPITDAAVEDRLSRAMVEIMESISAPPELYDRLDLGSYRRTHEPEENIK